MLDQQPRFLPLAAKTAICHTLTYFLMGALAFHFLHYADFINKPNSGMRPTTSPLVFMGPALQVFRGVLFAAVFYPFRERLFCRRTGWLLMGWMLIALGILGTLAAPPGSLEGFIYTAIPPRTQFQGYLEVVPQALLLSALLCYWVNQLFRCCLLLRRRDSGGPFGALATDTHSLGLRRQHHLCDRQRCERPSC